MATAVLSTLHMLNIFLIAKSIYVIIYKIYIKSKYWKIEENVEGTILNIPIISLVQL